MLPPHKQRSSAQQRLLQQVLPQATQLRQRVRLHQAATTGGSAAAASAGASAVTSAGGFCSRSDGSRSRSRRWSGSGFARSSCFRKAGASSGDSSCRSHRRQPRPAGAGASASGARAAAADSGSAAGAGDWRCQCRSSRNSAYNSRWCISGSKQPQQQSAPASAATTGGSTGAASVPHQRAHVTSAGGSAGRSRSSRISLRQVEADTASAQQLAALRSWCFIGSGAAAATGRPQQEQASFCIRRPGQQLPAAACSSRAQELAGAAVSRQPQ